MNHEPVATDRLAPAGSAVDWLARAYDVALLDLDGVVYVGADAVVARARRAAAPQQLSACVTRFVTNNAARPPGVVADHLRRLGIPCADADVVTSAQAAARVVATLVRAGSTVLVVGGAGLVEALAEHGLVRPSSSADAPAAVVQGFSPDIGWALLAEGAYALATGVPWVASNLDATVPTPRGRAPGNGTLVAVLATTSGRRAARRPASPNARCSTRPSPAAARRGRSSSATGSTPTSRARSTPASTACSC